ncbi:MAG TPA: hypothetical protein VGI46_12515 [Candidatus Acidoferrum sp.]|jgi:hypothetical protein
MSAFPLHVLILFAVSALAQLILLILLFSRDSFRRLPQFTAYVALNLAQGAYLLIVYSTLGTSSIRVENLAWYSECVTLLAQGWATAELLKATLRPYQGIWGLIWRSLVATSTLVIVLVALTTRGEWAGDKWFELNRGYHLTFAVTVIVCLLLVRYYSIEVPAACKWILGGFCFYSCTEILINTILQTFFRKAFDTNQTILQTSTVVAYIAVLFVWVAALWKPIPADTRQAPPPSDSIYQRLSPEINDRLRKLNEKLLRLWKMEARPQ